MAMTLIVLAATMGNKYGGLKQLEGIGPNGETILDFSVYDAKDDQEFESCIQKMYREVKQAGYDKCVAYEKEKLD